MTWHYRSADAHDAVLAPVAAVRSGWRLFPRLWRLLIIAALAIPVGLFGETRPSLAAEIGGKDLQITPQASSIDLNWTGGTVQAGYRVVRSNPFFFTALPPSATDYTDTDLAAETYCYIVFPIDADGNQIAQSDGLCARPALRSASRAPGDFSLSLNQSSTSTVSWNAPGDQVAYLLLAVPWQGNSPPRLIPLEADDTSTTDDTGGVFTCYMLFVGFSNGLSNSDATCAAPGLSQFPPTTTARIGATGTTSATDKRRPQATMEKVFKEQLFPITKGPAAKKLEQKLRDGMKKAEQQLRQTIRDR